MNLGENIKRYRTNSNMTQKGLADKLNISFQSVSKWENGLAEPSIDCLIKMAKLFDVSLDRLLMLNSKEKTNDFLKTLNKKSSLREVFDAVDVFLTTALTEFKGDITWQQGAIGLFKAGIGALWIKGNSITIQAIEDVLLLKQPDMDRQEKLTCFFKNQPEAVAKNSIQALDCPAGTFRAYISVLLALLSELEKNN